MLIIVVPMGLCIIKIDEMEWCMNRHIGVRKFEFTGRVVWLNLNGQLWSLSLIAKLAHQSNILTALTMYIVVKTCALTRTVTGSED